MTKFEQPVSFENKYFKVNKLICEFRDHGFDVHWGKRRLIPLDESDKRRTTAEIAFPTRETV